ncbi:hypothetical protein AB205_0100730 [Aquarana catesbeiana]|uniref:Uncharacterized protein n=1 Tax=Aquarana catesbeiana TaxID=8400 RepID=A0A2G9R7D6_AQUCT|nr:hypothetical protein AB205_0100730 [Aquarana catesbeiana]
MCPAPCNVPCSHVPCPHVIFSASLKCALLPRNVACLHVKVYFKCNCNAFYYLQSIILHLLWVQMLIFPAQSLK